MLIMKPDLDDPKESMLVYPLGVIYDSFLRDMDNHY